MQPSTRATWAVFILAGLATAACVDSGDEPIEVLDDSSAATDDDFDPSELEHVPDGTTGWARVQTPYGVELLPYTALGGVAMYQGDMGLGLVSQVDARLRGGAFSSTAERWPNGIIQYGFAPTFWSSSRQAVRNALDDLEARTDLNFVEVDYQNHSGPWIEVKWAPSDADYAGMSTSVGMMGCGEIHCSPHDGCRSDCGQWIYFASGFSARTVQHEFLHAAGMFHEQSRSDRSSSANVATGCLAGNADQYAPQSSSLDLGPYDFNSIMHYSSWANCMTTSATTNHPVLKGCVCLPLTRLTDGNGDGFLDPIFAASTPSREDINAIWRTYNHALGTSASGDGLGDALAIGDFDGDGYDDVAMGAPNNGSTDAGAVFVYKGTSDRLVPWKILTQGQLSGQDEAAGDHFGAALAAADFDGDGFDDLLVGTPDEDVGAVVDAGAVFLYRGGTAGLAFDEVIVQTNLSGTNDTGDRFGAAVAFGQLTNTGVREMIIGAPGDRTPGLFNANVATGSVYINHRDDTNLFLTPATRLYPFSVSGGKFGSALAVGKIDSDGNEDLAVGSPNEGSTGAVRVYSGRTPPEFPHEWSTMATFRQTLPRTGAAAGDRFGHALVIANVAGSSSGEVVVGAPGVSSDAGKVFLYNLTGASLAVATPMALLQNVNPNGSIEAGDEFGYSLVAYQRDSSTAQLDLVVGSPGENGYGIITTYRGETAGITAVANVFQSSLPGGQSEAGDRFGAALASGNVDGAGDNGNSDGFLPVNFRPDLVVSAPGESVGVLPGTGPTGGEVGVFEGGTSGAIVGAGRYVQESAATD